MINRTFRSLDESPKLIGFTIRQWAALIAASVAVLALVHLAALPVKAAITLTVFTIGLPAALTYVSESGGLQLGGLLLAVVRWRLGARCLAPASGGQPSAHRRVLIVAAEENE